MAKYDIEEFVKEFQPKFAQYFTQKIEAINAEKDDDVELSDLDPDAWFFQSLDDSNHGFNDFCFYYLRDIRGLFNGRAFAMEVELEIDLLIMDQVDGTIQTRVLRYSRALMEAAQEAWDKVMVGFDRPELSFLAPIDVKLNNSSYRHKVFGVVLKFVLST